MARSAMRVLALAALVLSLALLAATASSAPAATGSLTVLGGEQQVEVTGAQPGARYVLTHRGRVVSFRRAGSLGGIVFRSIPSGPGYQVALATGGPRSKAVTVMSGRPRPPSTAVYNQRIPSSGYGYLTVRDGIQLAIDVRLPGGSGPYPTLIEYAGYGYADPYHGPDSGIAQIANLLGFAVVDVNMRGTGCSGGAYDFFDRPQSLDGYDVIETVARQPWVLGHQVGMLGISYGGISQLFVASTDPPHLAAITPLSVIDNTITTLYAGGLLNTGFAVPYAAQRDHDALPASPTGGQSWAYRRIQQGDLVCKANQALHTAAVSQVARIASTRYYRPSIVDPLAPITFVNKIKAPVFLACQFEDEQTGGHCPDLAQHFTGSRHKWFTFTNGAHIDSLDPDTATRWFDFMELYVARRAPRLPPGFATGLATAVYSTAMGIPGVTLPSDPIQSQPTYGAALAAFQRIPQVRVLFDNGAGAGPFVPYPGFERSFSRFPVPGTVARSWYLGPRGALTDRAPRKPGRDSFRWSRHARALTDFTGDDGPGGLWGGSPAYNWTQNPRGTAVSYVTAPLRRSTVVIGAGAVQAWVKASTRDVDLQVTVSEVRPDGKETFVQDGWLRASDRKLDPRKSTLLEPVLSLRKRDVSPLPRGRFTELTIPLYFEGHAYRAGSRIRITIAAPNGDQPVWSFDHLRPAGRATVSVAFSRATPSRLVLPVVPGVSVPTRLPACPALRGEPCRSYVPR